MSNYRSAYSALKNTGGRTIIEVLLALAIFTIGFLAVGTLVFSTTRNNTAGNTLTQATMLAREKIEILKTLPPVKMQSQCRDDPKTERLGGIFKRECDIRDSFSDSVKILEVTVSWRRQGRHRAVVLKTLTRGNGL